MGKSNTIVVKKVEVGDILQREDSRGVVSYIITRVTAQRAYTKANTTFMREYYGSTTKILGCAKWDTKYYTVIKP